MTAVIARLRATVAMTAVIARLGATVAMLQ